jgi:hypothetical protein
MIADYEYNGKFSNLSHKSDVNRRKDARQTANNASGVPNNSKNARQNIGGFRSDKPPLWKQAIESYTRKRKAKKLQSSPGPVAVDTICPTSGLGQLDELEPQIFLPENARKR